MSELPEKDNDPSANTNIPQPDKLSRSWTHIGQDRGRFDRVMTQVRVLGKKTIDGLLFPSDKLKTHMEMTALVGIITVSSVYMIKNGIDDSNLRWLENTSTTAPSPSSVPTLETTPFTILVPGPNGDIILKELSADAACDTESVNGNFVGAAIHAGELAAAKGSLSQTARDNANVAVPAAAAAYATPVPITPNHYDLANIVTVCLDPSSGLPTINTN